MTEHTKERCCARIYSSGRVFSGEPCSRLGKVERNGKWYCGTHDPEKVAERRAKRHAAWRAEQDSKRAHNEKLWRRRQAEEAALAGIPTEELPGIVQEMVEALAPFAKQADEYCDDASDEEPFFERFNIDAVFTLRDLRRARAILARLGRAEG